MQRLFLAYRPSFVVDSHHQSPYVSADGDMVTTSVLGGTPPVCRGRSVTPLGAGSVLVEPRGDTGRRSAGKLIRIPSIVIAVPREAAAEGTLGYADRARADLIPVRSRAVDSPHDHEQPQQYRP